MMRQRQQKIVEYVQQMGIASIAELAEMFDVSPYTIRRDIDYLSQSRLIVKVKGGAQRIETPSQFSEAQLPHRMHINLTQKEKIAQKALEFIHPGDTIFLDGSSTITCFARAIAASCHNITVVTNSILVALELSEATDIRLVGLGGIFDRETFSYVGFDADNAASAFFVNKAFFSCAGFLPSQGTFENAPFNRNTKKQIANRAAKVFLLIDSTKFGKPSLAMVLESRDIDTLITDHLDDPDMISQIREAEISLVAADKPTPPPSEDTSAPINTENETITHNDA